MSAPSEKAQPVPFEGAFPIRTVRPTQPGTYWFHGETTLWAVMVEVYEKDGRLIVWWLNQEYPVEDLKGSWRGPIRQFGLRELMSRQYFSR